MAGKHVNKTEVLSEGKGKSHARAKRIYFNRTLGGNCNYCIADGDINAGPSTGPGSG